MIPFTSDMHQLCGLIDADGFYKAHDAILAEIERADAELRARTFAPSTAHAPLPAFRSPDMQAQSHQVAPGFGSAFLKS